MRTQRTNGTTTYQYTYLGSQLTHMTVGEHTLYFAYDAAGIPLSLTYDGENYYYVTNLQGDVVAILDDTGNEVVRYAYDAWGNLISTTDLVENTVGLHNPLRYRGYVYDVETELYYLQSRYYNPDMGRFINGDSFITTGQGLLGNNMLAYCNNNPLIFVDPTGHMHAPHADACGSFTPNAVAVKELFGVSLIKDIPEFPDDAMLFLENITSVSITGPFTVVKGKTVVMDKQKYCEYEFAGVGLSASISIPIDHSITVGYVYGLENVADYCGTFYGTSANGISDISGGAIAWSDVYAEIIGGGNFVPSIGVSMTYYTTTQTDWIYGPANINFIPNVYPKSPLNPQTSV